MERTLTILLVFMLAKVTLGQMNPISINRANNIDLKDYNHYNIEKSEIDKSFVLGGTLFDNTRGDNDINIIKVDDLGNVLWDKTIDKSLDDRLLDLAVDGDGNIFITGYILEHGLPFLYISKVDAFGNVIDFKLINKHSVGTKILLSEDNQTFFVGGLTEIKSFPSNPFSNNSINTFVSNIGFHGFVSQIDFNYNIVWQKDLSIYDFGTVNNLVEAGDFIFVTGSIFYSSASNTTLDEQGVMSSLLDKNTGVSVNNFNLTSTNFYSNGISAVYIQSFDQIFLVTSNTLFHNPVFYTISNVSSGALAFLEPIPKYLWLGLPSGGTNYYNYSPFHLLKDPNHPEVLYVAGYVVNDNNTIPSDIFRFWVSSINVRSFSVNNTLIWHNDASNQFKLHGGQYFSTFNGQDPMFFTQEIICLGFDSTKNNFGFPHEVIGIAPNKYNSYGIDVFSTEYGCFEEFNSTFNDGWFENLDRCQITNKSLYLANESYNDFFGLPEISENCEISFYKMDYDNRENLSFIDTKSNLNSFFEDIKTDEYKEFLIFDLSGKLIKEIKSNDISFNFNSLSSGIYILNYKSKTCTIKKFISIKN